MLHSTDDLDLSCVYSAIVEIWRDLRFYRKKSPEMEEWQWTSFILCCFGLLKEFRPSEPFVTQYIFDFKNVTSETVIHVVFPISTYTILATLVVLFLITDFLRYKPIIVFQASCYVATWTTLIWGESLLSLKIVQVLYGIACSADVAYYTYIYAQVRREHYSKVTSYTYTAAFVGKFLGGSISQVLVSTQLLDFHQLNYITLTSVSSALLLTFFLPKVEKSIYFHRETVKAANNELNVKTDPEPRHRSPDPNCLLERIRRAYPLLWADFKSAYRSPYVLKWSIWWAIATCLNLQVQNYVQALWKVVDTSDGSHLYNGGVNAVQCLLCATLSFAVGHIKVEWTKWGEFLLSLLSWCQAASLLWMSWTESLPIAYANYILFRALYQILITIANAEVAKRISKDSCALIFGVNIFLALVIQTVLTLSVSAEGGLALAERPQFMAYGGCFAALGIAFLLIAASTLLSYSHNSSDVNANSRHSLTSIKPLDLKA